MPVMAKQRTEGKDNGPKKPKRSGASMQIYIRKDLMDLVERAIAEIRPKPSKTAVVENALEDYFIALGWLPRRDASNN